MDLPYSVEELVEATKATIRVNEVDSCYIRPLAYLGYGEMGLNPLPCPVQVSIAVWPWGTYLGDEGVKNGVRMKVSSWRRIDPNVNPVAAKGTGIYVNSSLAKVEALQGGLRRGDPAQQPRLRRGVHGREPLRREERRLVTPPLSSGALEGITRDSVMTIARDLGIEVREDDLLRSDLYLADEAFLTGTAAEMVPMRSVDDREIGQPGEITRKIQEIYFAAVHGEARQYKDWLEYARCLKTCGERSERDQQEEGRDLRHDAARRCAARGDLAHRRRQAPDRGAARLARRPLHRGRLAGREPEGRRAVPSRAHSELQLTTSTLVAFGSTRRPKGKVDSDDTLRHLVEASTSTVCIVGKCWDYHVLEALQTTLDEGVAMVAESIEYLKATRASRSCSTPSTSSTATGRNPEFSSACSRPRPSRAPTVSCCATPTAVRCRTRSR